MKSKYGHEETKHLGASTGTLFRDDEHWPVYLLKNGKFAIVWGGLFSPRESIKAIDKLIARTRELTSATGHLVIFQARDSEEDGDGPPFKTYRAVDWKDNGKIALAGGGSIDAKYSDWYVYDANIAASLLEQDKLIRAKEAELKALRSKRGATKSELVKVRSYDFQEVLKTHGEKKV